MRTPTVQGRDYVSAKADYHQGRLIATFPYDALEIHLNIKTLGGHHQYTFDKKGSHEKYKPWTRSYTPNANLHKRLQDHILLSQRRGDKPLSDHPQFRYFRFLLGIGAPGLRRSSMSRLPTGCYHPIIPLEGDIESQLEPDDYEGSPTWTKHTIPGSSVTPYQLEKMRRTVAWARNTKDQLQMALNNNNTKCLPDDYNPLDTMPESYMTLREDHPLINHPTIRASHEPPCEGDDLSILAIRTYHQSQLLRKSYSKQLPKPQLDDQTQSPAQNEELTQETPDSISAAKALKDSINLLEARRKKVEATRECTQALSADYQKLQQDLTALHMALQLPPPPSEVGLDTPDTLPRKYQPSHMTPLTTDPQDKPTPDPKLTPKRPNTLPLPLKESKAVIIIQPAPESDYSDEDSQEEEDEVSNTTPEHDWTSGWGPQFRPHMGIRKLFSRRHALQIRKQLNNPIEDSPQSPTPPSTADPSPSHLAHSPGYTPHSPVYDPPPSPGRMQMEPPFRNPSPPPSSSGHPSPSHSEDKKTSLNVIRVSFKRKLTPDSQAESTEPPQKHPQPLQ